VVVVVVVVVEQEDLLVGVGTETRGRRMRIV
jgi:hypothetical protein